MDKDDEDALLFVSVGGVADTGCMNDTICRGFSHAVDSSRLGCLARSHDLGVLPACDRFWQVA